MLRSWWPGILLLPLFPASLRAGDLYSTDFEGFPAGDNLWHGTEGWVSNDVTSGAQGILPVDFFANPDLQALYGKTAYLGFETPRNALTFIERPINYDPADPLGDGLPCVVFDTLLGVQDSTNGFQDQFLLTFYDNDDTFLAAIVFDNTSDDADVLRWQGFADSSVQSTITGVPFARGNQTFGPFATQILSAQIDLVNNTWSAQLSAEGGVGGAPLFTDAQFTDPALMPLTLGKIAAEWELGRGVPRLAGDNWLFVADWNVRTVGKGGEPFQVESITRNEAGVTTITWPGEPGFDYQVWYSDDLRTWHDDLPESAFPNVSLTGSLSFTDRDTAPPTRYYRVERIVSP